LLGIAYAGVLLLWRMESRRRHRKAFFYEAGPDWLPPQRNRPESSSMTASSPSRAGEGGRACSMERASA